MYQEQMTNSYGWSGWTCPKCGLVNAPWVASCPCYQVNNPYTYPYPNTITWSNNTGGETDGKGK
jgi:hypothetical protein